MAERPKCCAECGATRIAEIVYGLVQVDDRLKRQMAEGKVVLGGCNVSSDSPRWMCLECEETLGDTGP